MMTVTIPYDNTTKVILDPITTHRDVGCVWANFVTSPGTPSEVNIPVAEGDGTMPISALGLGATPTITDLENAGYGATS